MRPDPAPGAVTEIVAVDLGGTHVRFALARLEAGRVARLEAATVLKAADYGSLGDAWRRFLHLAGRTPPPGAAIAVAGSLEGERLELTNNPWVLRPAVLRAELGVERLLLLNDFGAVAHAVDRLEPETFAHLAGPDLPLPAHGVVSVVGPGTGLGVAQLVRAPQGSRILETEGGHMTFAPLDAIEDAMVQRLRARHGRVSVERLVSGAGLLEIFAALAQAQGRPVETLDAATLWARAIGGEDAPASAALDRFCRMLGAVAGDVALAQGAHAVVIAGGLGLRLRDRLASSGFAAQFQAKGRFAARMRRTPVKLVTHPEPGLYGAAAAFAAAPERSL